MTEQAHILYRRLECIIRDDVKALWINKSVVFSHIFLSKRSLQDETVLKNKVNKVINRFASRWSFTTLTVASSPIQRGSPGFLMQKGRGFLYSLRELLTMDFMEIKIKATSLAWKPFFFLFWSLFLFVCIVKFLIITFSTL